MMVLSDEIECSVDVFVRLELLLVVGVSIIFTPFLDSKVGDVNPTDGHEQSMQCDPGSLGSSSGVWGVELLSIVIAETNRTL